MAVKGDDRGIAAVWAAALMQVLLVVAAMAMATGSLVVVRYRVSTVADLAAIAASQGSGCARAEALVRHHGMRMTSCAMTGADAVVEVVAPAPDALVRVTSWLGRPSPELAAQARAGP